jgi:hypothetical protein
MCVPRAPKDFRNYIELHMAIALSRGEDTTLAKFVPRVDSERWLVAAWCAGIGKPKVGPFICLNTASHSARVGSLRENGLCFSFRREMFVPSMSWIK